MGRSLALIDKEMEISGDIGSVRVLNPVHNNIKYESLISQALVEATGRSLALIKKEMETSGDIGSVAAASRGQQRTMFALKRLTVQGVRAAQSPKPC